MSHGGSRARTCPHTGHAHRVRVNHSRRRFRAATDSVAVIPFATVAPARRRRYFRGSRPPAPVPGKLRGRRHPARRRVSPPVTRTRFRTPAPSSRARPPFTPSAAADMVAVSTLILICVAVSLIALAARRRLKFIAAFRTFAGPPTLPVFGNALQLNGSPSGKWRPRYARGRAPLPSNGARFFSRIFPSVFRFPPHAFRAPNTGTLIIIPYHPRNRI